MTELAFRMLSLATGVAYMTVRTVYERRLGRPSKAQQMKTATSAERLDLMVIAYAMTPMWVYMLTRWLDFAAMGLPDWVRFVGLGTVLLGIVVLWLAHSALGASFSPLLERPAAGLVTGGVYRYVRHPMYASFFLFNVGMWLLTSNWIAGLPAVAGMLFFYFRRVDGEERLMLDFFGDEYLAYAARAGRVVPGVGRGRLAGERLRTT